MTLRDLRHGGQFYFKDDLMSGLTVPYVITAHGDGCVDRYLVDLNHYNITYLSEDNKLYNDDIIVIDKS